MTRPPLSDLSRRITERFNACEANGGHQPSGTYVWRQFHDIDRRLWVCAKCNVPIVVGGIPRSGAISIPNRQRTFASFTVKCAQCGKEFSTTDGRLRTCSVACGLERQRARRIEYERTRRTKKLLERVCERCGGAYRTYKYGQRYCSMSCASLAHARSHCPHGHLMVEANIYRDPQGHRNCRTCRRVRRHAA